MAFWRSLEDYTNEDSLLLIQTKLLNGASGVSKISILPLEEF